MDQHGCPRVRGRCPGLALAVVALGLLFVLAWPGVAQAQADPPPPDSACKLCHADNTNTMTLPSGETLPLGIDLETLSQSVHGAHAAESIYCTDCHQDRRRYLYPHQPNPAQTYDEFVAEIAGNCQNCHTPIELHNPGHLAAEDNPNIPTCTDCHGGHDVAPTDAMATDPVAACQSCHTSFDDPLVASVHEEVVANLGPDQSCRTCHADYSQTTDTQCKTCHSLLQRTVELESGEAISLHVNVDELHNSVHGYRLTDGQEHPPFQCTDCHRDEEHYAFPHQPITADNLRELTLDMELLCQECHVSVAEAQSNSVHAAALADGELGAATCADCHGSHGIQDPNEPRERISQTCGQCHAAINDQYTDSVHGAALLGEDNPDVPVCIDCHGVHNIGDPTTAAFRVSSPDMCAECHADEEMMAKYGISTDVFDTYVADFHGTTVALFEQQHPDQETNKAVCYDCHGVHNILPANDENSQVIKENLLTTCQKCHPDASANFPDAWTSHFKPSLEHNPLVYLVDLFYQIMIPAVVGGFLLFIGTDVYRRTWNRFRRRKGGES